MSLKRQLAVGDIHGCYGLTKTLVEDVIKFNHRSDQLIFIGDYIDRGKDNRQVVEYVGALKKAHPKKVILLIGNHEELAYNAFKNRTQMDVQLWFINGGIETINSYGGFEAAEKALVPFIETLDSYHETDTHVFVHGGIPDNKTVKTAATKSLLWTRNFETYRGKPLIVGHTPHEKVTKYENTVVVDSGAVFYGKLSAYDVLNDKVYAAEIAEEKSQT
jgi:serine/threonine protein phosphatase 1